MRHARASLLLVLWAAASCGGPAADARRPTPPTPENPAEELSVPVLMRLLKESTTRYTLVGADTLPPGSPELEWLQFPRRERAWDHPRVERSALGGTVRDAPMPRECVDALRMAEPHYRAGEYDSAAAAYEVIREAFPGCYEATAYLGDTHLLSGRYELALAHYDAVIRANPADYRGYFFRSTALLRMRRIPEALDALAWGLAMRPHYESLLVTLVRRDTALGLRVRERPFVLRGAAVVSPSDIQMIYDPARPYWQGYAVIKAAWVGEPRVRRRMMGLAGEPPGGWTMLEEQHALLGLLDRYLTARKNGGARKDPDLEFLHAVVNADMLPEFVLYDIGSRMWPHVVALQEPAVQQRVQRYVLRFVLGVKA
jgi:tetratricopeptide (TPR) repeat protein